ncbi:MAG: hypothetical protein IT428_08305 [Planctomycetaceae bacterium]|nr:hypothetical protein [Planctomycetaceae bacterium]
MASRDTTGSTPPRDQIDEADPRRTLIYAMAIAFLAGVIRWVAAGDDFWQDEIWSWVRTVQYPSTLKLLFVNDENNHILNSWFIAWLGPNRDWFDYRLPNVIAGTGSVLLAGWINRRRGAAAVLAGMTLLGASYLMVHYSSEARGYGLVVFFSLLAFALLDATTNRPSFALDFGFAVACILGVLSQAVFVYAFASLLAWAVMRRRSDLRLVKLGAPELRQITSNRQTWWMHTLIRFGIPMMFMAWLYWINLRLRMNAGGPILPFFGVISQTLSLTVGGPWAGAGAAAVALAVTIVLIAAIARMYRNHDDAWVFYACILFVMPIGLLLGTMRDEIYPRYFVISIAFACVLLGQVFAACWDQGGVTRGAVAVLIVLILVGNGRHIARLVQVGRGRYFAALDEIVARTKSPEVRIGSDFDFRNRMLVGFYARMLNKPIVYVEKKDWPDDGPEWYLAHDLNPDGHFPAGVTVSGHTYALQKEYPFAGLSGWRWGVYRRQ